MKSHRYCGLWELRSKAKMTRGTFVTLMTPGLTCLIINLLVYVLSGDDIANDCHSHSHSYILYRCFFAWFEREEG